MLQQAVAQQIHSFREREIKTQYEIGRAKLEMDDLRQNRAGSSTRGTDLGHHHNDRSEAGVAKLGGGALHMTRS